MGIDHSKNINIHETIFDGIYIVDIKKYPDYPIAYLRLMHDKKNNRYCIPQTCDSKKKFFNHRKIIVVGMRLSGGIHEQSFYLSTGKNSIDTLKKFLPIDVTKIKDEEFDLWLPFTGMGYYGNDIKAENWKKDLDEEIKLLKTFFNCTEPGSDCAYGRFGNVAPNLMQISYCLGGIVWGSVSKNVKDHYSLEDLPTLQDYMTDIPCTYISTDDNINCSIKINKYIGNACVLNYAPELLKQKNKIFSKKFLFDGIDFDINKLEFNWNIVYKLVEKGKMDFIVSNTKETKKYNTDLPDEYRFFVNLWNVYILAILNLNKENKGYVEKEIVTIIISDQAKKDFVNSMIEKIRKTEVKTVSFVLDTKPAPGSKKNPHKRKEDASVDEYYTLGKRVCQRHK